MEKFGWEWGKEKGRRLGGGEGAVFFPQDLFKTFREFIAEEVPFPETSFKPQREKHNFAILTS